MRKIAIYCRVSTDEQASNKEGSITSQVQRLQLKVDEKNRYGDKKWGKVVRIYKDEAYSGKNINRPEFQRMLLDIESKKIDTVMVTELSRLSRSVTDFLNFIKQLEDAGCDFICPQYDFDTTSPAGKVFVTIIMALAQFERELTAERIKNNFYARALRGLTNGGYPILGYDKNPEKSGHLIVNESEAKIVKNIFDLYLEADGVAEVVNFLNDRGFKNKSWMSKKKEVKGGRKFNIDAIWRLLTHRCYIGEREVNKDNKRLNQSLLKEEEKYSVVKGSWTPIIDVETFNKVQSKLSTNKRKKYPDSYEFILSGILVCDECGGALSGQSATGKVRKHYYYGHNKKTSCRIQRYNAEGLEKLVKKWMFSLLNHKELKEQFVAAILDEMKEQPNLRKSLLSSQKMEIKKLTMELDQLAQFIIDNPLAKQTNTLVTKIQDKEDELKKAKEIAAQLKEQSPLELDAKAINPQFVLEGIEKLRKDNFRKAKVSKKKSIIQCVIKSIHIHPENVLKIDFWTNRFHAEDERQKARQEKGVILPFRKLGKPLVASYKMGEAKGGRFPQVRERAEMGLFVLSQMGDFRGRVGSMIAPGAPGQT